MRAGRGRPQHTARQAATCSTLRGVGACNLRWCMACSWPKLAAHLHPSLLVNTPINAKHCCQTPAPTHSGLWPGCTTVRPPCLHQPVCVPADCVLQTYMCFQPLCVLSRGGHPEQVTGHHTAQQAFQPKGLDGYRKVRLLAPHRFILLCASCCVRHRCWAAQHSRARTARTAGRHAGLPSEP